MSRRIAVLLGRFGGGGRWLRWLMLYSALCVALPTIHAQQAGGVDPSFSVPSLGLNRNVSVVAVQSDGKILVGGTFHGGVARLNADGTEDTSFNPGASVDNTIQVIAQQSDGKIVLGGNFATVNGVARSRIARLNTDGTLDTGFDPGTGADNQVFTVNFQIDGKLVVAGLFLNFNGSARSHVARLNTDGSLDPSFDPGTAFSDAFIYCAALQNDGKIVAGGIIMRRLNADGSVDSNFQRVAATTDGFTGVQSIIVQSDGRLIVEGTFTLINGVARNHIARVNADGTLDTTFDPGVGPDGDTTSTVLQTDGKIVIGGVFAQVNGVARSGIARLNADGSLDTSLDPGTGTDNGVHSVALQGNGEIVIGGGFSSVGGASYNGIARLTTSGSVDTTFKADIAFGPNVAPSLVVAQSDGKVIIAGGFTQVSGVTRIGLARLNSDGSLDTSFNAGSGPNSSIFSMALQTDGKLVVGGIFSAFNGIAINNVARLNTDGSLDTGFNPGLGTGGYYLSLVTLQPDGKIIVSGNFSTFNGTQINSVARLNSDGSLDNGFQPAAAGQGITPINALVLQSDGKILFGMQAYGTSGPVPYPPTLVRLNSDGSLDTSFAAVTQLDPDEYGGLEGYIDSIGLQSDGKIIISGSFTEVDGASADNLARLNPDGSLDTTFDAGTATSDSFSITVQADDKIIVQGSFGTFDGVARSSIARLNADGSLDSGFDPASALNAGVGDFALASDGTIVLIGGFTQIGTVVNNYVARVNTDGTDDIGFVSGEGVPTIATLALQSDDGKVVVGGNFFAVGNQAINALARLNTDGTLDQSFAPGFAAGDSVQAVALQPDDGDVLVAAVLNDASISTAVTNSSTVRAADRALAMSGTANPIYRCDKATGVVDTGFEAYTDGATLAMTGLTGKITLIAGNFSQVDGVSQSNLARLNPDGSLDTSFVGTTDAIVRSMSVSATGGTIVVGGNFANVDGTARSHVARLNADGSLDASFNPGVGPNGSVNAVRVLSSGLVLVGGSFTQMDGASYAGMARLNPDGSLDTSFHPGPAPTDGTAVVVNTFDMESDDKVVVGGSFEQWSGMGRHNVARVMVDGSVDVSYDPGAGPDATVYAVQLQSDDRTLVGGSFSAVDGVSRQGVARLLGDVAVTKVAPVVTVVILGDGMAVEGGENGKVAIQRDGDTSAALTVLYKIQGSAKSGVDYKPVTDTVTIPAGAASVKLKIKPVNNETVDGTRVAKVKLKASPNGSYTLGSAAVAKIKIIDND